MDFTSDNSWGAAPEILAALAAASDGPALSYGDDPITARLAGRLNEFFGREVAAYPVVTGTAANALALATLCPPHGAIICHAQSHIAVDECGAPEFFTHGARLVLLNGKDGKIDVASIEAALPDFQRGIHASKPSVVSITQASEFGTVYRPTEIAAIANAAHGNDMTLHMDGARFANALVHLDCAPADITWKAGVDALSFGATKNGALCAEAVVFFDKAADFEYRRKKSGHLLSKMRFLSAQLDACLENNRWRIYATRANALAQRLAKELASIGSVEIAYPVEANAVFASLPDDVAARLREQGAKFYDWAPSSGGRTLVRLVCSFATPERDIGRFAGIARGP
ncbi:MAG TPA: beta-eliminating lyase-related protein [Rhizomicrobium sp.]|jgi:threonine aldolase|nr:beta-eliminating lyase-related protein [Rhizomicrobium sp.]